MRILGIHPHRAGARVAQLTKGHQPWQPRLSSVDRGYRTAGRVRINRSRRSIAPGQRGPSTGVISHPGRMDTGLRPIREKDLEMCRRLLAESSLIGIDRPRSARQAQRRARAHGSNWRASPSRVAARGGIPADRWAEVQGGPGLQLRSHRQNCAAGGRKASTTRPRARRHGRQLPTRRLARLCDGQALATRWPSPAYATARPGNGRAVPPPEQRGPRHGAAYVRETEFRRVRPVPVR